VIQGEIKLDTDRLLLYWKPENTLPTVPVMRNCELTSSILKEKISYTAPGHSREWQFL